MTTQTPPPQQPGSIRTLRGRRRAVGGDGSVQVRLGPLQADQPLPLLARSALPGLDPAGWLVEHRRQVEEGLREHGAILFRGFEISDPEALERLVGAYSGSLLEYRYRSTPRSDVKGNVYTSTRYPADQSIPLHNEMSYSRSWPLKLWFLCLQPADEQGETPLGDSRAVYRALDPALRRRFEDKGVLYVRNYGGGVDLPWQEVFQTADRSEVESLCRSLDIEWRWQSGDRLRTRQISQAVARHPDGGERVWFNQAHLFHVSSLPDAVRESLLAVTAEEDLPRNTYYGDGSPLEASVLEEIRGVYAEHAVVFSWRRGDLLLLDNVRTAHGRRPFRGPRQVVVAMSEASAGEPSFQRRLQAA